MTDAEQEAWDGGGSLVRLGDTDEVVRLDGADEELGKALEQIDATITAYQDARRLVNDEVVRRVDRTAKFSGTFGGVKYSVPSPDASVEHDARALAEAMQVLVDDDVVTQEAYDAAFSVEAKVTMPAAAWEALRGWVTSNAERGVSASSSAKLSKRGLNALLKVGGERARHMEEATRVPSSRPRRVKVGG